MTARELKTTYMQREVGGLAKGVEGVQGVIPLISASSYQCSLAMEPSPGGLVEGVQGVHETL